MRTRAPQRRGVGAEPGVRTRAPEVKAELGGLGLLRGRSGTGQTHAPEDSAAEQRRLRSLRGGKSKRTSGFGRNRSGQRRRASPGAGSGLAGSEVAEGTQL